MIKITLDVFKEIIDFIQKQDKLCNDCYNLGIDISEILTPSSNLSTTLLEIVYSEKGANILWWWLYEETEKTIIIDNVEYDVLLIDDLYKFMEKFYR